MQTLLLFLVEPVVKLSHLALQFEREIVCGLKFALQKFNLVFTPLKLGHHRIILYLDSIQLLVRRFQIIA